jgi:hypothetical protein
MGGEHPADGQDQLRVENHRYDAAMTGMCSRTDSGNDPA